MNAVDLFRKAMADARLIYSGELIADGVLHRFAADDGKPHNKNSWYVLHDDGLGLQLISQSDNGETVKRFIKGTPIKGNYCPIGKPSRDCTALVIGEGWATMASVYTATGLPCVVAFSANNLEAVARVMRGKFPTTKLIISADDDSETENKTGTNTGREAAQRAAKAVGGFVALPTPSGVAA